MKVGLIIHSVTGNTLAVAKVLKDKLAEKGHDVTLEEIKVDGKVEMGQKEAEFTNNPSLEGYDVIVFGSHTEAFQLETAMQLYFKQAGDLTGCRVACISTHQFPFKWMGGNAAVKKMKALCEGKGAEVIGVAVVDWSPESKRASKIETAVEYIAGLV